MINFFDICTEYVCKTDGQILEIKLFKTIFLDLTFILYLLLTAFSSDKKNFQISHGCVEWGRPG